MAHENAHSVQLLLKGATKIPILVYLDGASNETTILTNTSNLIGQTQIFKKQIQININMSINLLIYITYYLLFKLHTVN